MWLLIMLEKPLLSCSVSLMYILQSWLELKCLYYVNVMQHNQYVHVCRRSNFFCPFTSKKKKQRLDKLIYFIVMLHLALTLMMAGMCCQASETT